MFKVLPFWWVLEQDFQFCAINPSCTATMTLARSGYVQITDEACRRQQACGWQCKRVQNKCGEAFRPRGRIWTPMDLDQVLGGAKDTEKPRGLARHLSFFKMAALVAVPSLAGFPPFLMVLWAQSTPGHGGRPGSSTHCPARPRGPQCMYVRCC